ncbi:MAG TPA: hypothetical protein VIL46_16010, partial [Gemmataceae bacterium]
MRTRAALLGLAIAFLTMPPLPAAPPSPLELVRGLRNDGKPDLAMEYLQKVAPALSAAEKKVLPLEYARTRLDLAAAEGDDAKRKALLRQARGEFEGFLKANAKHRLAPQANVELARLFVLQGQDQLSAARRHQDAALRQAEVVKARPFFENAAKRFDAAVGALEKQIEATPEPKTVAARAELNDLRRSRLRAMLDQGIALYELAGTYAAGDAAAVKRRGEQFKKAKEVLNKLALTDDALPVCWEAKAWAAQCDYDSDFKDEADRQFKAILAARESASAAGKRMARYFQLRHLLFDGDNPKRFALAAMAAEEWLRDYPAARRSREGISTQYYYALALTRQAEQAIKRDPRTGRPLGALDAQTRGLLERAAQVYKSLAETDNEYTERAERNRLNLVLDLSGGRSVEDVTRLSTFEECFLAAQVEQALLARKIQSAGSEKGLPPDQVQAETRKTYEKIVNLLRRGLTLAGPKESARDVLDAQMLLTFAYQTTGREMAAAVLGEHVARTNPKSPRAVAAAAGAVQAYGQAAAQARLAGLPDEDAAADTRRLVELARYMDATWPTETATDGARMQLGYHLLRAGRYAEACRYLAKVSNSHPAAPQARLLEGGAAFLLARSDAPAKEKQAALSRAAANIAALPAPAGDAGPDTLNAYLQARIQLGQLYLLDGNDYAKAVQTAKAVQADLGKFGNLDPEQKAELEFSAQALELSGLYGQAAEASRKGDLARVAELLNPAVDAAKTAAQNRDKLTDVQKAAPSLSRLDQVRQNVLTLALRSSVQEGKIDRAREVLTVLEKSGSSVEATVTVLRQVVQEIRGQVEELRKAGKEDEAKKTADSFVGLLDQVARRKDLPMQMRIFLAQGYGTIDRHAEAAALLEEVFAEAAPALEKAGAELRDLREQAKGGDGDADARLREAEERHAAAEKNARTVEFLLAKAYREAGQYAKAQRTLDRIIGTREQPGWGYGSIEARKESFYLLEDQQKWREAVNGWASYARVWQNQIRKLTEPGPDASDEERRKYQDELRRQEQYKS